MNKNIPIANYQLPAVKILTDDIEVNPILDFKDYADAIVNMMRGSIPKFSVGIYGEWGTGKTTLMRIIEEKLKSDNKVLTIWFNAWRYEREDQFAIIALMKTIAYAMGKHPIYKEIKPIIIRGIKIFTKSFLAEVASRYIGEKGVEEFKTKLLPEMDFLAEVDRDTIYFDGINKIEMEMAKIMEKYDGSRVIVFIDDLYRCSPKKALEVFESVKVFLGLEGFMYIIGLSHETISKLITAEYQNSGIKGEQYIRKLIQIPITIPEWNDVDIKELIHNLSTKLDDKYKEIIEKNMEVIASAVEFNPREVKRFINNFIVAHEVYSNNNKVKAKELLVVQALKVRWNTFYIHFSLNKDVRTAVKALLVSVPLSDLRKVFNLEQIREEINKKTEEIESLQKEKDPQTEVYRAAKEVLENRRYNDNILNTDVIIDRLRKQLEELREKREELRKYHEQFNTMPDELKENLKQPHDFALWTFLDKQKEVIFNIKDWKVYRRAVELVREIPWAVNPESIL
jgi:predicted KAP-like P-loop ATPase